MKKALAVLCFMAVTGVTLTAAQAAPSSHLEGAVIIFAGSHTVAERCQLIEDMVVLCYHECPTRPVGGSYHSYGAAPWGANPEDEPRLLSCFAECEASAQRLHASPENFSCVPYYYGQGF